MGYMKSIGLSKLIEHDAIDLDELEEVEKNCSIQRGNTCSV